MHAISARKLGVVKYLVEKCKADVNARNPQRQNTPLIWAISAGQLDVMKYLLECKVDVNARDEVTQPTESNKLLVAEE